MPELKEPVIPVEVEIVIVPESIEAVEMRDIEQAAAIIVVIDTEHKTTVVHIAQRIGQPEEQLPERITNRYRDLRELIPDRRNLLEPVLLLADHQVAFLQDVLLPARVLHPAEVAVVAEDNLSRNPDL